MKTKTRHARPRQRARRRDAEKTYPRTQFVAKLRRLARAVERSEAFTIRVAGETLRVPAGAAVSIEHERESGVEEVEFQVRWKTARHGRS